MFSKVFLKRAVIAFAIALAMYPTLITAQNFSGVANSVPTQAATPFYSAIPTSATAAVNNQTTLTITAPTNGQYIYVCYLALEVSQDGTASAITNGTTSTTNFNSFATKFSMPATVNTDQLMTFFQATPGAGCVKSAQSNTATTFVSPSASAHAAFTWYATYYVAP